MLSMQSLTDVVRQLTRRLDLLDVEVTTARFNLALHGRSGALACRTHDDVFDERELDLVQISALKVPSGCDCPVTAAVLSTWCKMPELALALLALDQLEALNRQVSSCPDRAPRGIDELLQLTTKLLGQRSLFDLTVTPLKNLGTGRFQAVLDLEVDVLRNHIDRRHRHLLSDLAVRKTLQRACGGRDEEQVWVLLRPIAFRFGDFPDMRLRTLGWAITSSWVPDCRYGSTLSMLPYWAYDHLRRHLPDMIGSLAYPVLSEEVRTTALTLWRDAMEEGHDEFDACVRTAVLLCR